MSQTPDLAPPAVPSLPDRPPGAGAGARAAAGPWEEAPRGALDPMDRLTETMFGLLMALTFTCTMSIAAGDTGGVRAVIAAAFGCNLAWGIVDGVIYVLTSLAERRRDAARLRALQAAGPEEARALLRAGLPHGAGAALPPEAIEAVAAWARRQPPPEESRLRRGDLRAALTVFALVVAATVPASLPFLLLDDLWWAMRASNLVALAMLVGIGWGLDVYAGDGRARFRLTVPAIGTVLVVTTIALGG